MKSLSKLNSLFFITVAMLITLMVSALVFSLAQKTTLSAVSASNFNPGNIIDDEVFYNKDSMTIAQIQSFLDRTIGTCDTWGTGPSEYGGGTRSQYAAAQGWPTAPYACLNNYHENPDTNETSYEKGGGAFSGGISAANIIYTAAQTYNINPQVLLVMLKKESAGPLTADKWPLKSQYKYAMGYACPDSGPNNSASCDSEKAGLYKQMMLAAWQLKYYRDNPNSYRYAIGWNDIQYSPTISCGTKRVFIENIATLSLYIYTPYTPNDAAINNYPGTAPCGAYGNRNFFMFFNEWFGSTRGNSQIDLLKATQDIKSAGVKWRTQLGNPTSEIIPEFNSVPRVWQSFEKGTVIWTQESGAHSVLLGAINDRWKALGGSVSNLGPPTSEAITESSDGRTWQDFKSGTIIHSLSTGAWEVVPGPIGDKWRSAGGSMGTLGKPTSSVEIQPSGVRSQSFEKGTIVRQSVTSQPNSVVDIFNSEWKNNLLSLGVPTTDAIHETKTDGRIWQNFKKGVIISADGNTAWAVNGLILKTWQNLGGSLGKLGRPTSRQITEADGRIWQDFENGVIIQKNAKSNPHSILKGEIHDRWKMIGGSLGELGIPTTSQTEEADGRIWQDFENGTVIWSQTTGAWEIQGGFYVYWKQNGGSHGAFGKPTSPRYIESDGSRWQKFEKKKLTWRDTSGWTIANP